MRYLFALATVALAIASVLNYQSDLHGRSAAERFIVDFDVNDRRPEVAATVPLVPAADLAANIVADVALSDTFGTVHLGDASPELRDKWLRAVERLDREIDAARAITLAALAARPGWPEHSTTLGELAFAAQRRSSGDADARLWQEPLRIGITAFPGDDRSAGFLASAYLESWPSLTDAARAQAARLFPRALLDDGFAARNFPLVVATVGADAAASMLTGEPDALRSAFDAFARMGDMPHAALVYRRWETAEWHARTEELREIEERGRLNDVEKQRQMTDRWLSRHRPGDFDTPAGREQVLRVLQLAINDRSGAWLSDPRATAVRYLLNHRMAPATGGRGIETAPGGAVVAAVVGAMTGVPEPIRARARLLGGDVEGAQSLFERSDSAGSLEWTPFLLDLAAYRIAMGNSEAARAALDGLAPAAQQECDVLALRERLAQLQGSNVLDHSLQQQMLPASAWSTTGVLSVCLDPGSRQLLTSIDASKPAILAWGWNEGRAGTLYVGAGNTPLRVGFTNRSGRQAFFVRAIAGGPLTRGAATIVRE